VGRYDLKSVDEQATVVAGFKLALQNKTILAGWFQTRHDNNYYSMLLWRLRRAAVAELRPHNLTFTHDF